MPLHRDFKKVLVVDDSQILLRMLTKKIAKPGLVVEAASLFDEAFHSLLHQKYDIVASLNETV